MELTRDTGESLPPCLLPVASRPWRPWVATAVPIKESVGVVTAMPPALCLSTAGSSETGRWDTQSGQIVLLDCGEGLGQLTLRPNLHHADTGKLCHQHESRWSRGLRLSPAGQCVTGRLHVEAPRPFHQPPEQSGQQAHQPQRLKALGFLQEEPVDKKRVFEEAKVLLDAVLLLRGLQHIPRPMGHLSRGGYIRQEHKTGRLVRRAGDDLRPRRQRDLQALPQRFDYAGRLQAWPSRAILRVLLDDNLHRVRGALQRPHLGRCSLGISTTAIRLRGRRAHGGLQCRRSGLQLAPQVRLPPLILAAGVHDHGSLGLAI